MNVLIFGSQTDIGKELKNRLKENENVDLECIFLELPTLKQDVNQHWDIPQIGLYFDEDRNVAIEKSLMSAFVRDFDYIINCHEQPLKNCPAVQNWHDFEYNCLDSLKLINFAKKVGFKGLFINLSSFDVYGNSPNGMDLIRTDIRFELQEARSENQELAEERFGYDSAYGISEKMILAPKMLTNFGHSKMIIESTLEEIAKKGGFDFFTLRLPYVLQYNIKPEMVIYSDRINRLFQKVVANEDILTTKNHVEKSVYDFLTPEYIANFIFNIVDKKDKPIGVFNIGSRGDNEFSELELIRRLYKSGYQKFKVLNYIPLFDGEQIITYYFADCRELENVLESHTTKLEPSPSIVEVITNYLAKK